MLKRLSALILIASLLQFSFPRGTAAENTGLKKLPMTARDQEKSDYVPGEVIVKYKTEKKKEAALDKVRSIPDEKTLTVKDQFDNLNMAVLKSDKKSTQDLLDDLKKDAAVEFAEPNYRRHLAFAPNDTYFPQQWALQNTGQSVQGTAGTAGADISASKMWDIENSGAANTIIAVLDDGADYSNSDMAANMWDGSSGCKSDTGAAISGGCPHHGWNYAENNNDPFYQDHGGFIASIIASVTGNSTGIAGLSRYNHNKIMAVRFGLDIASEIKGINFAKQNGAKIINASFVGSVASQAEKNAIDAFPGIFVAAAGNGDSSGKGLNVDSSPQYPCAYTSSNLICVGSSDQNDALSAFSNYSTASVDIVAPGENIIGLFGGTYYVGDGTSFATPHVAGAAGVLWSQNPSASIATVKNTLLASSDHKTSLLGKIVCQRRLNADEALKNMQSSTIPVEGCLDAIYKSYSQSAAGNWNNDGIGRIGLYNNSTGLWYLDTNGNNIWNGSPADKTYYFGYAGTTPVSGDWNHDGKTKVGIYDGKGNWYLDMNNNGAWEGTSVDKNYYFGYPGTYSITGDWNGDGKAKIGVYDGKGRWYLDINGNGAWDGTTADKTYLFGYPGTYPISGDWNGDGKVEIGVYDGAGRWYLDINGNGAWDGPTIDKTYYFGYPGTYPVSGDWNGDGKAEIGVYKNDVWYLDKSGNGAWDGTSVDINIPSF